MAYRKVDESSLNAVADAIRVKTGGTEPLVFPDDMVAAIETLGTESVTYPVADEPETMGQRACLARAAQMRDIQWVLQGDLTMTGGSVYNKGKVVTGLPYSSVRKTDRFIGYNISLYTFMTAVHNPRSLLYTTTAAENTADNGSIANLYYGINCSVLGSYAHGWDYHSATNTIPELSYIEQIDPADMKLCDLPVASKDHGGSVGHVVMVTGITRNEDGSINTLEITESTYPIAKATTMTYADFVATYIDGQGYKVYRDTRLHKAAYQASQFVQVFEDEAVEDIVYSSLCTNRGDKVTISTDEDITLNVLISEGYESIKVYKDGTPFGTYTVSNGHIADGDLVLTALTPGVYTAVLCDANDNVLDNAGTSFEVCEVTAYRYGERFYFKGADGIPVRVVFKNSSGYTLAVFDLTEDDVARGYVTISDYIGTTPAQVCVPFKTLYGFVVARFDYSVETEPDEPVPPEEAVTLPEEYQQVEYIATDGSQYIDTGVMASDHADGILYSMKGNITGFTVSNNNNYFFGCLNDSKRSGNVSYDTRNSTYPFSVYAGSNSAVIKRTGPIAADTDFVIVLRATSNASSADEIVATINGTSFVASGNAFASCDMPSANIYLFTANGVAATNGKFWGKLYSFAMDRIDGTPIRKFVPCYRVADGVIGLYDTVEGKFYTNAGTGSFTKGSDV